MDTDPLLQRKKCLRLSLKKMLCNINIDEKIILIGDFNFDVYNGNNTHISKFLKGFNLTTKLDPVISTTNHNTQIDIIFSNMDIVTGVYNTYFSDQKPIYAVLNENESEIYSTKENMKEKICFFGT